MSLALNNQPFYVKQTQFVPHEFPTQESSVTPRFPLLIKIKRKYQQKSFRVSQNKLSILDHLQ